MDKILDLALEDPAKALDMLAKKCPISMHTILTNQSHNLAYQKGALDGLNLLVRTLRRSRKEVAASVDKIRSGQEDVEGLINELSLTLFTCALTFVAEAMRTVASNEGRPIEELIVSLFEKLAEDELAPEDEGKVQ